MAAPVHARTARGRLGDGLQPSTATKVTVTPPYPGQPSTRPELIEGLHTRPSEAAVLAIARRHPRPKTPVGFRSANRTLQRGSPPWEPIVVVQCGPQRMSANQ